MEETIKDVVKDNRSGSVYFDDADFIRNFEEVLMQDVTLSEAKKVYPQIIVV